MGNVKRSQSVDAVQKTFLGLLICLLVATTFSGATNSSATEVLPRGVHLSITGDPDTTMTVTWFTDGALDPGTLVMYGSDPGALERTVSGTSHTVPEQDDIRVHVATMTGLAPGETFHYRVGSPSGWSDEWSSHTAPQDGTPYRIVLFADQGVQDPAAAVTNDMLQVDADLILIAGDLAYAENDHLRWNTWFDMNEPLFATTPMMSSIGNHEGYSSHGSAAYTSRVSLPGNEIYYSFDYAGIHYLVLQSTTSHATTEGIFEDMVDFAHADLQEAVARRDAGEIDFIAILQHHPLYSNHASLARQYNTDLITWQEPILDAYDVDLLLTGHNHHYERSFPMVSSIPTSLDPAQYEDPVGWIQVISGGAGRSLYNFQHPDDFWPHSAAHARIHHFVTMDVAGPVLDLSAISAGYIPGEVLDGFRLARGGPGGPLAVGAAGSAPATAHG